MEEHVHIRSKITWYSFAFSLLVIWIHAYNAELFLGNAANGSIAEKVELFVGERISQIAVPGFFMISGYLFFRDFTWEKLSGKWERRIRSVLVPYILWNVIYYAGYLIASRLPWLTQTVGKGVIPFTLSEFVAAVLHYKYNPVFWYLYQLLLLIVLAPLLYPVLNHVWSSWIWFGVLWYLIVRGIDLPCVNEDALLYYSSAACLALYKRGMIEETDSSCPGRMWGVCLLFAAVAAGTIGVRFAVPACLVLCRLSAVGGWWLLLPSKIFPEAGAMAGHNFFLYAMHFAIVRLINKSAARLLCLDESSAFIRELVPLTLYFLMPLLVLGASRWLVALLRYAAPGLGRTLNGGR